MSIEFREYIDKENLELDCKLLKKMQKSIVLSDDIDDLVCDTLDKLAKEGLVTNRESIDVAYYIATEIKRNFIL